MFAKNVDYKEKFEAQEEQIKELKHQHVIEEAELRRTHEVAQLEYGATIEKLDARLRARPSTESHDEREKGLDAKELSLDKREALLAEKEKAYDARVEVYGEVSAKIREHAERLREEALQAAEAAVNDKDSAQYKAGHADGHAQAFADYKDMSRAEHERTAKLLHLSVLANNQAPVVVNGKDNEPTEASKLLADAFAKHLGSTVDNLFADNADDEE
jgi:hypothetical protein